MALSHTVNKSDRLDVANNEFQTKLLNIHETCLRNDEFSNIGMEEFLSARKVLSFLVTSWVSQIENLASEEIRNFLLNRATFETSELVGKLKQVESHLLKFSDVSGYTRITQLISAMTQSVRLLNCEMNMANQGGSNNYAVSDQFEAFDKAADEFSEWFEATKSQKTKSLLEMLKFDPYKLRIQEFVDIPKNARSGSSDVEKTISNHIEDFKSLYRKKDGSLEMKDFLEYPMKVHETWQNHVKILEKEISTRFERQTSEKDRNLLKCQKIEGLIDDWMKCYEDKISEVIRKKRSLEDDTGRMSVDNTEKWNNFVSTIELKDSKLQEYLHGEKESTWFSRLTSFLHFFRLDEFIKLVEDRRSEVLKDLKSNLKELKLSISSKETDIDTNLSLVRISH